MARFRDYGLCALLLVGMADWLFSNTPGQAIGLSLPVFVAALAAAVAACHRRHLGFRLLPVVLLLLVGLLALVENTDASSVLVAGLCLAAFALTAARRLPRGVRMAGALGRFGMGLPLAFVRDNVRRLSAARRTPHRQGTWRAKAGLAWVMPVALAAGFVVLLETGNPVLRYWLAKLDPTILLEYLNGLRLFFWLLILGLVWPFLRPRVRRSRYRETRARPAAADGYGPWPQAYEAAPKAPEVSPLRASLCGPPAILRALLLFNAVFAAQTLLDAAYLWGEVELPAGITYASFAHRGAYLLVLTALLAASFVLLALRPGAPAAADRRVRALVYLWIGQNIALVLSSMRRLDLYVDVYALTHWRLAAFAWMGIVAVGLLLICARIALRRSNSWLIGANVLVVALTLLGSCFVDAEALIARFNVEHCREFSEEGVFLDVGHLRALGPAAIPAIDLYLTRSAGMERAEFERRFLSAKELEELRDSLRAKHEYGSHGWRSWTFRSARLSRYLEANAPPALPAAPPAEAGAIQSTDGPR